MHVIVGHPEGLRLPIKKDIKLAWMRPGMPSFIADYLIATDSEGKTLIRSPAAYTAWVKKLRRAMPPTIVDEDLPQPFKAERVQVKEQF